MADGEKLTGKDYFDMPLKELMAHPDFNPIAMNFIIQIGDMESRQLEDTHNALRRYANAR